MENYIIALFFFALTNNKSSRPEKKGIRAGQNLIVHEADILKQDLQDNRT